MSNIVEIVEFEWDLLLCFFKFCFHTSFCCCLIGTSSQRPTNFEPFEEVVWAVLAVQADYMPKSFTLLGLGATQTEKYVLPFIMH